MIARRRHIAANMWQERTDAITEALISHPLFLEASAIYCYIDFNGEAGTRAILQEAWRRGKKTAVPKIAGEEMEFFYINSFGDVTPGTFGIPEPVSAKRAPGADGLVVMPLVAFDSSLHRVGYGKGYYDRYLFSHPGLKTIALAFDMQMVEQIEPSAHDINPGLILTETKILK